jgi:hypothetical protein
MNSVQWTFLPIKKLKQRLKMTINLKFEEEEEYEEQESPWTLPKRRVKELETAGV